MSRKLVRKTHIGKKRIGKAQIDQKKRLIEKRRSKQERKRERVEKSTSKERKNVQKRAQAKKERNRDEVTSIPNSSPAAIRK